MSMRFASQAYVTRARPGQSSLVYNVECRFACQRAGTFGLNSNADFMMVFSVTLHVFVQAWTVSADLRVLSAQSFTV